MGRRCTHLWLWPWQRSRRCIKCGVFESLTVGQNSITLSPAGVGDVIRWSATKAAVAAGDLGMNQTSGKPSAYIAAASAAVDLVHEEQKGLWIPTDDSPQEIAAGTQTVNFTGLVGDTEKLYRLMFVIENDYAGNVQYTLRPNGAAPANQLTVTLYGTGAAAGSGTTADMRVADGTSAQDALIGIYYFWGSKVGPASGATIRRGIGGYARLEAATSGQVEIRGLSWNDTATAITSLRVYADQANGIGADSTLWLDRLGNIA